MRKYLITLLALALMLGCETRSEPTSAVVVSNEHNRWSGNFSRVKTEFGGVYACPGKIPVGDTVTIVIVGGGSVSPQCEFPSPRDMR